MIIKFILMVIGMVAFMLALLTQHGTAAQSGVRQWHVTTMNIQGYQNQPLHVVDTGGVCVYVTHWGIAAVPKSSLPIGEGCQ